MAAAVLERCRQRDAAARQPLSAPEPPGEAASAATIVALSSGRLPAAIAIIRLSGDHAFAAAEALAGTLPPPRRAGVRRLVRADGAMLDEALLLAFPAPDTATGEDVVEIHCHGGPAVVEAVLGALTARPNVRLAEAGEFTRRAFMNRRIDLTAAEGIADLLAASSEAQRAQAMLQASGQLRDAALGWQAALLDARALVEAALDFSDEADAAGASLPRAALAEVERGIERALAGFAAGERLREGIVIAIIGAPNAGKSSLLNALAGRDAAIVSPLPGTTRDTVEVALSLGGLPVTLVDTAGLRETGDPVEAEGVARARARRDAADIVVELTAPDARSEHAGALRIVAKADLVASEQRRQGALHISTVSGEGLDALRTELTARARSLTGGAEPQLVTRARQRDALATALDELREALGADDPVLQAEALRSASHALGRLVGSVDVEDVLGAIFDRFCIGK